MEDKEIAEAKKLLSLITESRIAAFLDLRKLTQSAQYRKGVVMATEHAAKHGDFSFLNNILALIDGTQHAAELIELLRPKLTFVLTPTKPRKLRRATPELVAQVAAKAANTPGVPQKIATRPVKKRKPCDLAREAISWTRTFDCRAAMAAGNGADQHEKSTELFFLAALDRPTYP